MGNRTIHGYYGTPTYVSWTWCIQRCTNPNRPEWRYYGGRGIKVCRRWRKDFRNFLKDMGERPPGTSLDRIDNNGNYEPSNCRWATREQQQQNRQPRKRKSPGSVAGCIFNPKLKAKPWRARIKRSGKKIDFGHFATEAEAAKAIENFTLNLSIGSNLEGT